MKKLLFLVSLAVSTINSYAQSTVFERNQEKARFNETHHISSMVVSIFETNTITTPGQYSDLAVIMANKDGYVSCTLNEQHQLVVTHESWLQIDDISDVLKTAAIEAKYKSPFESETTTK